jgi:DNA processing protein
MALVSDATVIIEAGEKSGAISQAWEALRLGRGLFLAESLATNPELKWPADLIRYGACVISDALGEAFLDELPDRDPELSNNAFAF